ncbi:MAG: DUF3781 domain-containing protein [Chitinispirillaceae bacterium]|nr:DUF3781 domain-containing protein [Chitinispirillaceae bacterium]
MSTVKDTIIKNLCYTDLVYKRINNKLNTNFSNGKIEKYILKILHETDDNSFSKIGKNFYVSNVENDVRITINSNTFRVITVDKISLV